MDMNSVLNGLKTWAFSAGLKIVLVLALALIVLKAVKMISTRLSKGILKNQEDEDSVKRAQTLTSVIRNLLNAVIIIIASMTVLGELGIEIGPVLAAAGILGIAVGFAGQSLVKDVINGFFLLLWEQVRVGDVVEVAGKSGLVEKINLKMTVLRDLAGNVHYIPNGNIDAVTNMTKDFSRYVFEIGVAYREDVDEVMDVIKQVDEEMRNDPAFKEDILEAIEIFGLDKFDDSAVVIKARTTTKPIKQWRVGREFNRRLKLAFDKKNIEIPFPHRTIYMGLDKKGKAAPLRILEDGKTKISN